MLDNQYVSLAKKENKVRKPKNTHLHSVLVCAAVKGDINLIKECLSKEVDVSYDGNVAVRLASQKGFIDIVEYLVLQGGDIEQAKIHGTKVVKEWANQYHCCTHRKMKI